MCLKANRVTKASKMMPKWLKNCCNKKDMNIFMAVGGNKRDYIWKSPATLFPMTTHKIYCTIWHIMRQKSQKWYNQPWRRVWGPLTSWSSNLHSHCHVNQKLLSTIFSSCKATVNVPTSPRHKAADSWFSHF